MLERFVPWIAGAVAFIDFVSAMVEAGSVEKPEGAPHPLWYLYLFPEPSLHYLARLMFVGLFVFCIYVIWANSHYRKTPMTIVRTQILINLNEDYREVSFDRTQLIRANLPDVTAYLTGSTPTSLSGICRDIRMESYCPGAAHLDTVELFGEHKRGYEAIHSFGRALRHRWYMLLVPIYFMNKDIDELPRWIKNNLTKRTQHWIYADEFNCKRPYMDFSAQDYPQHNLKICLTFESGIPSKIKVRRVSIYGAVDLHFEKDTYKKSIDLYVDRLHRETIRINWENEEVALLPSPAPPHADEIDGGSI